MDMSLIINQKNRPIPVEGKVKNTPSGHSKYPATIIEAKWTLEDFRPVKVDSGIIYGVQHGNTKRIARKTSESAVPEYGFTFPQVIEAIVISATHVIVSTWDKGAASGVVYSTLKADAMGSVWTPVITHPSGIGTVAFGIEAHYDMKNEFNGAYGVNYVLAAEYGKKTIPGNARKVYFSKDGGATFNVIFTGNEAVEYHIHAVHFDKYGGRIWVTNGDGAANRAIHFSDDLGLTWEHVPGWQPTSIMSFPKYVLFGADEKPMGVFRWSREIEQEERWKNGDISKAMEVLHIVRGNIDGGANVATPGVKIGDWEGYLPFTPVTVANRTGFIVATGDGGETCHTVWFSRMSATSQGHTFGLAGAINNNIISFVLHEKPYSRTMSFPKLSWI